VPGRTFDAEPTTGLGLDLERFTINGKAMAEDSTVRAELNIASPVPPGGFCLTSDDACLRGGTQRTGRTLDKTESSSPSVPS
jgi:hypothetical protein